ncbi:MAG: VOC family protein [Jannaschia helgolandensis]|uniref:VOC family protein n=1 Tax=Jannaschia helgolandensis TaxID=188906 RepID=UPI003C773C05
MKLGSFAYLVPDYDKGLAFFVDGLGFKLVEDIDQGRKRWVTVRCGPISLVLARADTDAQVAAIGQQFGGRVGLFLKTTNFARDARKIEKAGGVFEEAVRSESYGKVAVWRDPFGTRWDLIEPT